MSSFDADALSAALHDISNGTSPADPNSIGEKVDGRVGEWTAPQPYAYPTEGHARPTGDPNGDEGAPIHQVAEWAHNAKKYEWNDDFGDVGPEVPELEKELYEREHIARTGEYFEK